jgi:twitching motility protein PilT
MELIDILGVAAKGGASDIHLKVGLPPLFRIDGMLVPLKDVDRLTPEELLRMAEGVMTPAQREHFNVKHDIDFAYVAAGLGRFRINVFQQRQYVGMVMRLIPLKVPTIESLNLPKVVEKIAMEHRGLILVTGTTGSGKSTTMAAMIDHINVNRSAHIMTIEDPIEFVFRDKRSIINQREVGTDTHSFAAGLRAALRQDPDVILVGEMRDLETIETALTAAETGHLVLSTLHTLDAGETINRVIMAFPPHQQHQIRIQLGSIIKAVISQRLVPRADKRGRAPALEIMLNTGRVRELIEDPARTKELPDAIARSHLQYGMQTFDQSLYSLLQKNLVTYDEAIKQASNPDDFALRVSGISTQDDWDGPDAPTTPTGRP